MLLIWDRTHKKIAAHNASQTGASSLAPQHQQKVVLLQNAVDHHKTYDAGITTKLQQHDTPGRHRFATVANSTNLPSPYRPQTRTCGAHAGTACEKAQQKHSDRPWDPGHSSTRSRPTNAHTAITSMQSRWAAATRSLMPKATGPPCQARTASCSIRTRVV